MNTYYVVFAPAVADREASLLAGMQKTGETVVPERDSEYTGDLEVTSAGALIFRAAGVIDYVIAPGAYTQVIRIQERTSEINWDPK